MTDGYEAIYRAALARDGDAGATRDDGDVALAAARPLQSLPSVGNGTGG